MNRLSIAGILVCASLFARLCLGEQKNPWESLQLQSLKLDGGALYYEKSLQSKVDFVQAAWKKFLAEQAQEVRRTEELLKRSGEIIADVNRIVGGTPDDAAKESLARGLDFILNHGPAFVTRRGNVDLYPVTQGTTKDYLRKAGTLPGFSYDKTTDTASYWFGWASWFGEPVEEREVALAIPVAGPEGVEDRFRAVLSGIARWSAMMPGLAFHEVAEVAIVLFRLRPRDPYFRWFSDGFANAIAIRLLRKYVSGDAAREYAKGSDIRAYSDLEKEINLYYWMGNAYCVATPLKSEQRLSNARFAYATFEAQRLIEEHGIECVAQILDRACKEPRNDSRNLVAATREVTGVDVQKRFERYQTFQTKEQGLKKYADRVKAAPEGKGYQEVLSSFLRALELEGPAPKTYAAIAFVLTLMGNEQGGDRAMEQQLTLSKRDGRQEDYFALQKVFVEYALQCRSLKKAHEAAEEVLKKEPDFVPALAVRMDRLKASGDVSGAKEVARRVLELDKDSASAACRLAQEVLSLKEMK